MTKTNNFRGARKLDIRDLEIYDVNVAEAAFKIIELLPTKNENE